MAHQWGRRKRNVGKTHRSTHYSRNVLGCGGTDGGSSDLGPTYVDDSLELRTSSRVIDADLRDEALISSDVESGEYVFDATLLDAAGVAIESGHVLLIAEQTLIQVTSTTTRGNELVVNSDPATLPELVAGANADMISLKHVLPKAFVLRVPIPTALPPGLNFQFSMGLDAEIILPTLASAATQVSADFRYTGSTGFEFGGLTLQPSGNGGSGSADPSGPNTTAAGGEAGVVLKIIPFFTLNVLLDQAKAELQIQNNIGGSFEGDAIRGICSTTSIANIVKGGLSASWFGIPLATIEHEFYRKEAHLEEGQCRN